MSLDDFEKCVHSQIMDHLQNNKLLSTHQFGYRRRRSTDLASVCFLDQIRKAMDQGMLTGAIYVDLSKAFDTIGHDAIIQKLPKFGITGIPQQLVLQLSFWKIPTGFVREDLVQRGTNLL